MADPEFRAILAALYVEGKNREDIAEELDAHKDTITTWLKDERVRALVKRLARERVNRITRRTDAELEARLAPDRIKNLETKEILAIRKEMLDRAAFKSSGGEDASGLEEDAWEEMDGMDPAELDAAAERARDEG